MTRTEDELRAVILDVLAQVAPDADLKALKPEINFRDQMEFDSVDYLNFSMGLVDRLGIAIPDTDYPKLSSLAGCLAYLGPRVA